jgi:hypothetical protein
MNETLTALISFVGVLILFSVIVQSAQEAVKNILKLRVGVWERFFIHLYSKQSESGTGKTTYFYRLKLYIKRVWGGTFTGEYDKGFARLKELLITADNTFKDLKKCLRNIMELKPDAADTPRLILYQFQPLLEAVNRIKGLSLSDFLYIYVEMFKDMFKDKDLKTLYEEIKKFEVRHAEIKDCLQSATKEMVADFQTVCGNLLKTIEAVESGISDYRFKTEQNMDAWISQINEAYRRNMLKWTAVIGFFFVICVNADSFTIYNYLRSDTKIQAEIAEKVKNLKMVTQTDPEELNRIPGLLKDNKLQDAKNLSTGMLAGLEKNYRSYGASVEADRVKQLNATVDDINVSKNEDSKNKLQEAYDKIADFYIRLPKVAIEAQVKGLTGIGLPLGWTSDIRNYKEMRDKKSAADASEDCFSFILKKIGGLLFTAVLITFGAPFWNDILGALTGIKDITRKGTYGIGQG